MTPPEIDPKDALLFLDSPGYIWIDVREQHEWNLGHLAQARFMPLSNLKPTDFDSFSKQQHLIIVCRSGNRSRMVTEFLRNAGFEHAQNLSTGMIGMNAVLPARIPVQ